MPLHVACVEDHRDVALKLVLYQTLTRDKQKLVDVPTLDGFSPLQIAVIGEHSGMIDLLKAADAAFPEKEDNFGHTYNSDDPTERQQSLERLRACMPETVGGHDLRTRAATDSFFEGDSEARRKAKKALQSMGANATTSI